MIYDIKNYVNEMGWFRYKKIWFIASNGKRRCYWIYSDQVSLNVVGTVTIVISKKRLNTAPENAKLIVTNIPRIQARDVVKLYTRRWFVECLFHELKSACGLGHQQVTKEPERVERCVSMSMMAYLLILRFEYDKIPKDKHWSILTLKHFFICRLLEAQFDERKASKPKKKAI